MSKIKKMSYAQLYQYHSSIIDEMLKKKQKEYDAKKYQLKTPNDKLKCQICGGKYTRRSKASHDTSNKHVKEVQLIHENMHNLLFPS